MMWHQRIKRAPDDHRIIFGVKFAVGELVERTILETFFVFGLLGLKIKNNHTPFLKNKTKQDFVLGLTSPCAVCV